VKTRKYRVEYLVDGVRVRSEEFNQYEYAVLAKAYWGLTTGKTANILEVDVAGNTHRIGE